MNNMLSLDEAMQYAEESPFGSVQGILAAEVRRLQHQWDYYQDFCKQNGFAGITAMDVEIDRLRTELEQERKRLDWALENEAVYYCHGDVWRLCFSGDIYFTNEDIPTADPRTTIDELMEKAT